MRELNPGVPGPDRPETAARDAGAGPASGVGRTQVEAVISVPVVRLDPDLPLPGYAHPGDAGMDLYARDDVRLEAGHRALVATGLAVELPAGWVGLVHPRSGLAARHGITVLNAPGTVDAGYRGEIKVNLVNLDPHTAFDIRRGDRIAQLLIAPVATARLVPVDALSDSSRGHTGHGDSGGFGPARLQADATRLV